MRIIKRRLEILLAAAVLLLAVIWGGIAVSASPAYSVYIGGMPAGFTLNIGGAQVVGLCEVLTQNGSACPARDAEISVGDVIVAFGGMEISSASDIDEALAVTFGKEATLTVYRGGEKLEKNILPVKDRVGGKYRLGVLVRDSVSGIGTVTYIRSDNRRFGALGHAVAMQDGSLMKVAQGDIFRCSIVDVVKGERGKAGELKGLFMSGDRIAEADKNCSEGIFGNFSENFAMENLIKTEISTDVVPGKASIFTTIDGVAPKEYSIGIVKVDAHNRQNKNFVIKITDPELLSNTGGIVQGMSGSPIVQNGKLIGAVTHVFLNDPTRGYGISIANMIDR